MDGQGKHGRAEGLGPTVREPSMPPSRCLGATFPDAEPSWRCAGGAFLVAAGIAIAVIFGTAAIARPPNTSMRAVMPVAINPGKAVVTATPNLDFSLSHGRSLRPVRTVNMVVTAYCPGKCCCGPHASGITASGRSVRTNGMKLAAADPSLPFGTLVSIPGYDAGQPVPILDRGGAIKGDRLDVLMPTHQIAKQWGRKAIPVTIWEYAD
jgi:3D (Asp-Asp-Asp) domain-containing protein